MIIILEAINGWTKLDLQFGHPLLEVTTDRDTYQSWLARYPNARVVDRFQTSAISAIIKGGSIDENHRNTQ